MNLYEKASLIITPNAYKAGKIYAAKPTSGDGDLTFSRASSAMRRNASGVWESVANNVPRLHYSVGGGCPVWLNEPQRTNLILHSNQFTNAAWVTNGSGVTLDNQIISPDGTLNAGTFESVGAYALLQNAGGTVTAGQVYTSSIWLKAISGASVVRIRDVSGNNFTVVPTSEWVQYQIPLAATGTGGRVAVVIDTAGTKVGVWNGQLELGAFATSPIITTGSAVTRIADYFSLDEGGSASGGTWFIHIKNNTAVLSDTESSAPYIGSNSASGVTGWSFILRQGGGSQRATLWKYESGSGTSIYTPTTDESKIAVTWNGTSANVYVNGVKVVTNTSFATSLLQYLASGNSGSIGRIFSIGDQLVFPSPLTDAECIALTT